MNINRGDYVIENHNRDEVHRVIHCDGYVVVVVPLPDNGEDFFTRPVNRVTKLTDEEAMLYKLSN